MIYWCKKCNEPIFNKELHEQICDGEIIKLSDGSVCNPVFLQERKLLGKIVGEDLTNKKVWFFGSSKYYYDNQMHRIPYREWYKQKNHLEIADELSSNITIENNYEEYSGYVKANLEYIKGLVYEAENYIVQTYNDFKKDNYIPTVSFSGGKDSTVVSKLVRDALQDNSIVHFFGDTTLEFEETYEYTLDIFKKENPKTPVISSETTKKFFDLCKVFGPPSQHERWCCTIFKTSNLNKELEYLPGNSLSFLGIRHSESAARKKYERTQTHSKISTQINAMPIIEWTDYDVWLYIIYKKIVVNACYQYGYKRVGCWCCPNNSDWSMMLTEIYHPESMKKWKEMVYEFAYKTNKVDPDKYYEEGKWKVRRGASGLEQKNVSLIDTPCNLSDRARNIISDKNITKDIIEYLKPLGKLKIKDKGNTAYIDIFDINENNEYVHQSQLIIAYGTNVLKVLPDDHTDLSNLIKRIKCQLRKYQFCIRCSACDSVCPQGAINTTHGKYLIDENKCINCKKCIAKFYNGCIICEKVAGRKDN